MALLYVIAGHGAGDPGACAHGFSEAERVRALAARMEAIGGNDVAVLDPTRNWYADGGIYYLSIPDGAQLIELHMDSAGAGSRGGHVVIDADFDPDDYDIALADFITGYFPGRSTAISRRNDLRNPNAAQYRGISYRLLECCFITDADDLAKFNADLDGLARGILAAFGIGAGGRGWVKQDGRWWYENDDGSYPADAWVEIGGAWYLFDEDGWMTTGWQMVGDAWFYMGNDGAMRTGWFFADGEWFFAGESGAIRTGFVEDGGELYLLHEEHDGRFGALDSGWIDRGGRWMFGRQGGALARSAVCETSEGRWYAFDADGFMVENPTVEDGGCILV